MAQNAPIATCDLLSPEIFPGGKAASRAGGAAQTMLFLEPPNVPPRQVTARAMRPLWPDLVLRVWDAPLFRSPCCKGPMRALDTFEPIEPAWQAIREWIPAGEEELSFDLFDQRPHSGKTVEISREDACILVLDSG